MKKNVIQAAIEEKLRTGRYKEVAVEERASPHGWRPCAQVHADEIVREARFKSTLPQTDKDLIVVLNTATGTFGALELYPDIPELDLQKGGTRAASPESIANERAELQSRKLEAARVWCAGAVKQINEGKIRSREDLYKSMPAGVDQQLARSLLADAYQQQVMQIRSPAGVFTSGGEQLQVKTLPSRKAYHVWIDVRAADKDTRPSGVVVAKVDQSLVADPDLPQILRTNDRLKFHLQTRDNSRALAALLRAAICQMRAEVEVRMNDLLDEGRIEFILSKVINEAEIEQAEARAIGDLFPEV